MSDAQDAWARHQRAVQVALDQIENVELTLRVLRQQVESANGAMGAAVGVQPRESGATAVKKLNRIPFMITEQTRLAREAKAEMIRYQGGF